jgi:serine/threonine protein kinase
MPDLRTPCPTAQQLREYGLGKLSDPELNAIRDHLAGCPECSRKVAEQPPDSFVANLRAASPPKVLPPTGPHAQPPVPPPPDVPPELARSGKFEVLDKLGEGGMGAVYKARHKFLGELIAIKVMKAGALATPQARGRFLREMKSAGQLKHANIVRALDAEQLGDLLVLVMEFVAGITLDRLVAQRGPLPVDFACRCVVQAAQGLQHAHEKGMVHRDIKPANLIIAAKEKEVKLLDFGLARGPRESAQTYRTQIGAVIGTPAYMAPEQTTDASRADIRSDIYSLGCTLYYLLAGQSAFQRGSVVNTMLAQVEEQARPLTEVRADVPAGLWDVVAKMLAKKPDERFQTPKEVEEALLPFATGAARAAQPGAAQAAEAANAPTLPPGDTDEVKPQPPPLPAADATEQVPPFPLAEPIPDAAGRVAQKRKNAAAGRRLTPARAAMVAGMLTTALLGAVAVVVMTPDGGKVLVEIDQADAEVLVDGKKINVRVPGDMEPIEISVKDEREYTLLVKKGGFEAETRKFTYRTGKGQPIRVRLKKLAKAPAAQAPRPAAPSKVKEPTAPKVKEPTAEELRVLWVQPHGYFLRALGTDWFEKWDDGKKGANIFREVAWTEDFVELRHYHIPVTFRLYNNRALIKGDRDRDVKQLYEGKWEKEAAPEDPARRLWVEPHGYMVRGRGTDWFQKWDDGKKGANIFHEVARTKERVELRHYHVPVTFRLYPDTAFCKDERRKDKDFSLAAEGKWQPHAP